MMDTHGMKILENNLLPPKNFKILCLFNLMLVKPDTTLTQRDYNHEATHFEQQKELLFVFFYILYGIEWLIRLFIHRNAMKAYRFISFEREAYENDTYKNWVNERPRYYWIKFWKK